MTVPFCPVIRKRTTNRTALDYYLKFNKGCPELSGISKVLGKCISLKI
jgi:hypothetical protein